ncbi:PEGA domain-containing protein [Patescibacteria group bacterium]|nr:PEGA domain-containing protein [Patescibacteria group bacterium]
MPEKNKFNYKYLFKVIFYILALLAAIYLVLLASGYKLDLKRKIFVETGSIYLNSNPKDVKIYLNGRLKSNRAPFKLSYLLPGNYQVRVEKEGFKSWEKNLSIKSGLVAYESEVILYYNQPKEELFSRIEGVGGLNINKGKDKLLYFTDKEIFLKKINSDQEEKIFELVSGRIEKTEAANDFSKLLIQTKDEASKVIYLYCANSNCQEPYNLNLGLNLNFDKAKLTNNDNYPLLLSVEGSLYAIKSDFSKYYIEAKVLDYVFFNGKIYYLTDEEEGVGISSSDLEGKEKTKISIQKAHTSQKNVFSLWVDEKKKRLYLIGEEENLYQFDLKGEPLKKIETKAESLNFDNNNFLLIISGSELKVQGRVEIIDKEDSIRGVARYSQDPLLANWLWRTNHILFIRDNILKTVELKGSNETDLYSFQKEGVADFISISKNEVIVLDKGSLKKITLCEKGSLIDLWQ